MDCKDISFGIEEVILSLYIKSGGISVLCRTYLCILCKFEWQYSYMYTLVLIHRLKHTRCQILLLLCTLQQLQFFFQISQPIVHCAFVLFTFYACTCSSTQISSPSHICFFCLFSSIRDHTSIDIFFRYFAHFFCTHLYMDVVLLCDIDIYLWFVICYPSYLLFPFYIFFWSERLLERWCEWSLNTSMSTPFVVVKNTGHISFYTQQGFGICHNDYYFNTCTLHQ